MKGRNKEKGVKDQQRHHSSRGHQREFFQQQQSQQVTPEEQSHHELVQTVCSLRTSNVHGSPQVCDAGVAQWFSRKDGSGNPVCTPRVAGHRCHSKNSIANRNRYQNRDSIFWRICTWAWNFMAWCRMWASELPGLSHRPKQLGGH